MCNFKKTKKQQKIGYSKPFAQKQQAQPKREKRTLKQGNQKTIKQLLGELYADKVYLETLLQDDRKIYPKKDKLITGTNSSNINKKQNCCAPNLYLNPKENFIFKVLLYLFGFFFLKMLLVLIQKQVMQSGVWQTMVWTFLTVEQTFGDNKSRSMPEKQDKTMKAQALRILRIILSSNWKLLIIVCYIFKIIFVLSLIGFLKIIDLDQKNFTEILN